MGPHNTVEYGVRKLRTDVAPREPSLEPTMLEGKAFSSGEVCGILNDLCNAHLMYL